MDLITSYRLSESVWSFCVEIVGRGPLCRVVILRITISDRYIIVVLVRLFEMVFISVNRLDGVMMSLFMTIFIVIVVGPRMLVPPLLEFITILRPLWMHREIA